MITRVELSTERIAERAAELRAFLGYGPNEVVDPVDAIRRLQSKVLDFNVKIVDDEELPRSFAAADYSDRSITVRRTVWRLAEAGNPRHRFTLLEELAHYALAHPGQRNRTTSADHSARHSREIAKCEREARHFAGVFMVPTKAATALRSANELSLKFGLSREAAKIRWVEVERQHRRERGEQRAIPANTARAILNLNKRWTGIKQLNIEELQRQADEEDAKRMAITMGYTGDKCTACQDRKLRSDGTTVFCENCGWPWDSDFELS